MNPTEGGAPAPVMEQAQPTLEMNRPPAGQQEYGVQMISPEDTQALTVLEGADRSSPTQIENALAVWAGDENIEEGQFTVDDDPNYKAPEPAATIQIEEPAEPQFDPQMTSQQIDAEIAKRGANAANAYDQLVYQYPDRAKELAAAGNEQAAAAVARQAELARNPSTSTALETRSNQSSSSENNQDTNELARRPSETLREAQTALAEIIPLIDAMNANDEIPKEVKEVTSRLSVAIQLVMLVVINSMDIPFEQKQAMGRVIAGGERKTIEKKKEVKALTDTQPKLEEVPTEVTTPQLEAAPKRVLELTDGQHGATPMPELMQKQALLLPPPAESFTLPEAAPVLAT